MKILKAKNPLVAAFLAAFFVGAGQVYAKRVARGLFFFFLSLVFTLTIIITVIKAPNILVGIMKLSKSATVISLLLSVLQWLIIIDAYICAKNYNIKNNLVSETKTWKKTLLIIGIILFAFTINLSDLVVGTGSALYVRQNITQAFKIPTGAMRPTLMEGDRVSVDKAAYKNIDPQRGDIIVFKYPEDPSRHFIKRVVALPNEILEIKNGKLIVNGNIIKKPKILSEIHYYNKPGMPYGEEGKKIEVPESSYFVLGDNSASSRDSRYWGFVPRENIIGKANKIYYPPERVRTIE